MATELRRHQRTGPGQAVPQKEPSLVEPRVAATCATVVCFSKRGCVDLLPQLVPAGDRLEREAFSQVVLIIAQPMLEERAEKQVLINTKVATSQTQDLSPPVVPHRG